MNTCNLDHESVIFILQIVGQLISELQAGVCGSFYRPKYRRTIYRSGAFNLESTFSDPSPRTPHQIFIKGFGAKPSILIKYTIHSISTCLSTECCELLAFLNTRPIIINTSKGELVL